MKDILKTIVIGLSSVVLTVAVHAAQGQMGGSGSGGGGGNGSGKGSGNATPGVVKGELFGDLYIIVRDSNGVPLKFHWDWSNALNPEPSQSSDGFDQPIALTEEQWIEEGKEGDWDLPASCYWEGLWLVPMNEEGEVAEGYEDYTREVELGRLNLARAPASVLESAYEEALKAINSASAIMNDPCGRLHLEIDGEEKTIDSPRENLALYKMMMLEGYCPGITLKKAVLGDMQFLAESGFNGQGQLQKRYLDQCAAFIAAAGDKGSVITVDEVVYLNNTLGINELAINNSKKDVYFDYGNYTYSRNQYTGLEAELLVGPVDIVFVDEMEATYTGYYIDWVNLMDTVFGDEPVVTAGPGIKAFAISATDSIRVLTYIHDRAIPEIGVE